MTAVAIDISQAPEAATSSQEALDQTLLRACNVAAAPDVCVPAADTGPGPRPEVYVLVTWETELSVRIEIGRQGQPEWLERHLTFSERDPLHERWLAVGYAIGTLLGSQRAEQSSTPAPAAASSPSPPRPDQHATVQTQAPPRTDKPLVRSHALRLDVFGRVGTGLESHPRWGAGLSLTGLHAKGLFLGLDTSIDVAQMVGTEALAPPPRVAFWTVGLGMGVALRAHSSSSLEFGMGPLLEYAWSWGDSAPAQGRVIGGLRAMAGYRLHVGQRWSFSARAEAGARFGDTTINVDGARVDSIPLAFAGLLVSVGYDALRSTP